MTKFVNEQRVECPLEQWPGYIILPKELTPEQFDTWWKAQHEIEQSDEVLSPWLVGWRVRFHLVLEWHVEGVEPEHVTPDGLNMPSMKLIAWMCRVTAALVGEAIDFPKSLAPSTGAENGNVPDVKRPLLEQTTS